MSRFEGRICREIGVHVIGSMYRHSEHSIGGLESEPLCRTKKMIGHFLVALCLCFKTNHREKVLTWKWTWKWNSFSYQLFRTKTRFNRQLGIDLLVYPLPSRSHTFYTQSHKLTQGIINSKLVHHYIKSLIYFFNGRVITMDVIHNIAHYWICNIKMI